MLASRLAMRLVIPIAVDDGASVRHDIVMMQERLVAGAAFGELGQKPILQGNGIVVFPGKVGVGLEGKYVHIPSLHQIAGMGDNTG